MKRKLIFFLVVLLITLGNLSAKELIKNRPGVCKTYSYLSFDEFYEDMNQMVNTFEYVIVAYSVSSRLGYAENTSLVGTFSIDDAAFVCGQGYKRLDMMFSHDNYYPAFETFGGKEKKTFYLPKQYSDAVEYWNKLLNKYMD